MKVKARVSEVIGWVLFRSSVVAALPGILYRPWSPDGMRTKKVQNSFPTFKPSCQTNEKNTIDSLLYTYYREYLFTAIYGDHPKQHTVIHL